MLAPLRRSFAVALWLAVASSATARAVTPVSPPTVEDAEREIVLRRDVGPAEAIAQTPDGYLWFGTTSGLHRFDGSRFLKIPVPGDRPIRRLFVDSSGTLWIATGSGSLGATNPDPAWAVTWRQAPGALLRLSGGRLERLELPAGLSDEVWAFAEDGVKAREGGTLPRVWIGTENGLALYDPATGSLTEGPTAELPRRFVTAIARDARGAMWVGTTLGLAIRRDPRGRFQPVPEVNEPVATIAATSDGRLFVGSETGLHAFHDGGHVHLEYEAGITVLLVDRGNRVWVGTRRGLGRLDDGPNPRLVVPADDLAHANVTSLVEDHEHSIWAGARTLSAIAQLKPSRVRTFGSEAGLSQDVAFSVLRTRDGALWVSSGMGLSRFRDGRPELHLRSGPDLPEWGLRSMAEAPDGALWVTSNKTVLRIGLRAGARPEVRLYDASSGLPDDWANSVVFDDAGDLWITYLHAGIVHVPRAEVAQTRALGQNAGACAGLYLFGYRGPTGTLWFAGEDGLLTRVRDGRATCASESLGLPKHRIAAISEDADGTLWVATIAEAGLLRVRNGRFVAIPPTIGAPTSALFALVDDGHGHLWTTSDRGIWRLRKDELDAVADGRLSRVTPYVLTAEAGMRSEECLAMFHPSGALDDRGIFWAPTLRGLAAAQPPGDLPRPALRTVIEEVVVNGEPLRAEGTHELRIGPGVRHVEVRYAAPSFLEPRRLSFRYRLAGLETTWVDAGNERSARYTNLAPGRYSFEVAVRAPDLEGPLRALALVVAPAMHETWWFRAALVLALAGAVRGVYRARVRQIRARYAAVEAERGRIARELHDGLAQGFTAVRFGLDALRRVVGGGAGDDSGGDLGARQLLDHARGALDQTQAEARLAIWNIRGQSVDRLSLAARLETAVIEARRRTGLAITFVAEGPPPPRSAILEHELPRIAQEALTNAMRHAEATRIEVRLAVDDARLRLTVRDDGKGLVLQPEEAQAAGRFGVLSMRERATRVGGTLRLTSGGPSTTDAAAPAHPADQAQERGVTVEVTIPRRELEALREKEDSPP